MVFTPYRWKHERKFAYKSKKRRYTTVNWHINSSKSNNPNTSNCYNVVGNSNLPHINVQTGSSSDTFITVKTEIDTGSSISINNETIDENNISEEIPSHHNSAEVIDHTRDENGNNLLNYE